MGVLAEKAKAKKSSTKSSKKSGNGASQKTGLVARIEELIKSGKTVEEIAKKFNKKNKDIAWYVNYLHKRDRLPKNLPKKAAKKAATKKEEPAAA